MLNDDDDIPFLDEHDFDTEEYTIGPEQVVVGRFSFNGPNRDNGNVWLHTLVSEERDGEEWTSICLTPVDRRTLISILDMADDGGDWSHEWHTRYRGSDIRSACLLLVQAIRNWAVSELRFANSTRTESTSWTSIFKHRKP